MSARNCWPCENKPMRVGALRQILKDVVSQSGVSLEDVVQSIWG